jgi:hypothetical protein
MLLLLACQRDYSGIQVPKKDTGETGTEDTTPPDPVDTADTDGDLDDDGYTPEEGDCDDTDVRVSPARDEIVGDGKDNDCDGRVDEDFAGVSVAWNNGAGESSILKIDLLGRLDSELELSEPCYPTWIGELPDGAWALNNGYTSLAISDSAGNCTDIADFSDTDYGLWGITTSPDGRIFLTTVDKLYEAAQDGTLTELASWTVDFEDVSKHEAAITGLAYNPATKTLGLFDYFGGFATWNETEGFKLLIKGDWSNPLLVGFAGAVQEGKDWFYLAGDTSTGAYGVYRYDSESGGWVVRDTWVDRGYSPLLFTIDSDTGDAYLSTNGGWYNLVWRVVEGSGYAAVLYTNDGTEEGRSYFGIVPWYE